MKLVFKKNEDCEISVFRNIDGQEQVFSYVDMIKALIESREMEKPEISEGFTEAETKSIQRMVEFINKEIEEKEEDAPTEDAMDESIESDDWMNDL